MRPVTLDRKAVGTDFKRVREAAGVSLRQLSVETGIAMSHIWNLEKGLKEMSLDKFFALCTALGIPPAVLISDNVKVDKAQFYEASIPELRDFCAGALESERTSWVLGAFVAGCSAVLCQMLLTGGEVREYNFPTQGLSDAFSIVRIRTTIGMGVGQRRALLVSLLKRPLSTLAGLGLFTMPLFMEFVGDLAKRKDASQSLAWEPVKARAIDSMLSPFSGFESSMAQLDPHALGKFLREVEEGAEDGVLKAHLKAMKQLDKREKTPKQKIKK
jgi:transcriptional regulator with XRE-family HTH domain